MKVLTIRQPWATLIALGVKTIETRGHKTNVRGRIAIHAGAALTPRGRTTVGEFNVDNDGGGLLLRGPTRWPYRLPLGAIVATANLVDCVPMVDDVLFSEPCIVIGTPTMLFPLSAGAPAEEDQHADIDDQVPYGDFRPGRWAWMLEDVEVINPPVPFKGGQGWSKEWTP